MPVFMYLGFGLMFILIGNYLTKIRQNRTMGIKIKWALDDKENWNATHRLGDYIRYIFNDCQACVILQVNGETIVINGEDQASTEEIYNTLKDKCSKRQILRPS